MSKRYLLGLIALALLLAFLGGERALAATTGKITGVVKDVKTGEGLPGVNVVMEGRARGAVTDANGRYLILAIEPGAYSLTASIVGYSKETRRNVQVVVDYTTTVDFSLKAEAVAMGEVVVSAERPPVEPDKTTSKYVVSAADIEAVPMVRTSSELVALQPGMALDGTDRIRGSETAGNALGTAVGYYLDGIAVGRDVFTEVTTSAIQEVGVLTGGMNAEFGNALAGVVTLVSKEGESKFHGEVEYLLSPPGKAHWGQDLYDSPAQKGHVKWDNVDWANETDPQTGRRIHQRADYTDYMGHQVEASLSGPIGPKASFFASTRYVRGISTYPSPAPTSPFNTRNLGTLTFRPGGSIKVKMGGMLDRHKSFYIPNSDYEGVGKGMGPSSSGRNIFLPENWAAAGRQIFTDDMEHLTMTHSLGQKTYYEVKVYHVGSKVDTADVPSVTEPVRTDKDGWFYLPRKILAYGLFSDQRYGTKFDFTSQVSQAHLFQTGLEYRKHNYYQTNVTFAPTAKDRSVDFVGKDYQLGKGVGPWEASFYAQDKLEYHGLVVNAGIRWDYLNYGRKARQAPGMELAPMFRSFTHRVWELQYMEKSTPSMTAWSPRIGISHPISDKLSGHYFIGRFHIFPELRWLYRMTYSSQSPDADLNKNGKIDPPEQWNALSPMDITIHATEGMKPSTSTSVEMGVDWNFYKEYITSITAFYRSDEGLYGTNCITYWEDPKGRTSQVGATRNAFWINSRGGEVSFQKRFSDNFSFRIAYSLEWVYGIGYGGSAPHYGKYDGNWYVYPDSNYIASGRYWTNWKVEADGSETPIQLTDAEIRTLGAQANAIVRSWQAQTGQPASTGYYSEPRMINKAGLWVTASGYGAEPAPKNYDRRNQFSVQFFYSTPAGYGPRIWGRHPFGGLRVSSVYRMVGGRPFQYYPPQGQYQWKLEPPISRTDLHAEKDFGSIGGVRPALFLEVYNLFNEKNSTARYTDFSYIQYGLREPAPDDSDYLKYGDVGEWSRYNYRPRRVDVGLTFKF